MCMSVLFYHSGHLLLVCIPRFVYRQDLVVSLDPTKNLLLARCMLAGWTKMDWTEIDLMRIPAHQGIYLAGEENRNRWG